MHHDDHQMNFNSIAHNPAVWGALMPFIGWFGYYLSTKNAWPPAPKVIGSLLLGAFLFFVIYNIIGFLNLDLWARIAWTSLAASGGVPVYRALLKKSVDKIKGEPQ